MTIRDYIVRRADLTRAVILVWMLGMIVVGSFFPSFWRHGPDNHADLWFFCSVPALLAVAGWINWRTRCPRCRSRFHREAWFAQRSKFWRDSYNKCAHCGVSLDEPMTKPV
jgi:hypothetical protein